LFVGWGFVPAHTRGAYSAPPDLLTVFRGPTSKGRERGGEKRRGGKGKGRGGREEEGLRPFP